MFVLALSVITCSAMDAQVAELLALSGHAGVDAEDPALWADISELPNGPAILLKLMDRDWKNHSMWGRHVVGPLSRQMKELLDAGFTLGQIRQVRDAVHTAVQRGTTQNIQRVYNVFTTLENDIYNNAGPVLEALGANWLEIWEAAGPSRGSLDKGKGKGKGKGGYHTTEPVVAAVMVPVWEVDCGPMNGAPDWKPIATERGSLDLETISQLPQADRPAFETRFGNYYLRQNGFGNGNCGYPNAQWHQVHQDDADKSFFAGGRMRQIRRRAVLQTQ